jgi:hypothetical protein
MFVTKLAEAITKEFPAVLLLDEINASRYAKFAFISAALIVPPEENVFGITANADVDARIEVTSAAITFLIKLHLLMYRFDFYQPNSILHIPQLEDSSPKSKILQWTMQQTGLGWAGTSTAMPSMVCFYLFVRERGSIIVLKTAKPSPPIETICRVEQVCEKFV